MTKTTTERVKAHEDAKKAQGLKELRRLWAYPEDEPAIRLFASKLYLKRNRKEPK